MIATLTLFFANTPPSKPQATQQFYITPSPESLEKFDNEYQKGYIKLNPEPGFIGRIFNGAEHSLDFLTNVQNLLNECNADAIGRYLQTIRGAPEESWYDFLLEQDQDQTPLVDEQGNFSVALKAYLRSAAGDLENHIRQRAELIDELVLDANRIRRWVEAAMGDTRFYRIFRKFPMNVIIEQLKAAVNLAISERMLLIMDKLNTDEKANLTVFFTISTNIIERFPKIKPSLLKPQAQTQAPATNTNNYHSVYTG